MTGEDDSRTAAGEKAEMADTPPPVGPTATFTIKPRDSFDFSKPHEWEKWIRRFERFRLASNLNESSEANQVNTLVYCVGDEADDVLRGLDLIMEQREQYEAVKKGFDSYFVPKKNVLYERARFNKRVQQPGEPVDSFITALHALSENCEYGQLHDELLRDRIVVGLQDASLSEKMQLDKNLTLTKAIQMARQSEEIRCQPSDLRGHANSSKIAVDAMHFKKSKQLRSKFRELPQGQQKPFKKPIQTKGGYKSCNKCGKSPSHPASQCPAKDVECHNCRKRGHYGRVCRSASSVNAVAEDTGELHDADRLFLGTMTSEVSEGPWMADIEVKGRKVTFKIDTGADVSAIPEHVFEGIIHRDRKPDRVQKPLYGPGGKKLDVTGVITETLSYKDRSTTEKLFVVKDLQIVLLSRAASLQLKLVARLDSIDLDTVKITYPKLCDGLGRSPKEGQGRGPNMCGHDIPK